MTDDAQNAAPLSFCPKCGTQVQPGTAFCGVCGQPLASPSAAASPPTGTPTMQAAPSPAWAAPVAAPPVATPPGLVLPAGLQLASVGRRIGAWFLAIPLAIVTLGIGYVIWGLVIWRRGQTPALQVLGMRCWRPETQRVAGFWWMALREVVGRIAEGILSIITLLISFILMVTSIKRQSLHDLIAGTVVVHDPDKVLQQQGR